MALEAVTFDYWNTLCHEPPGGYLRGRRLEAMGKVLAQAGVGDAGGELLSSAYDAAWLEWLRAWQSNRQYTGEDAARHIAAHVTGRLALNGAVGDDLVDAFFSASAGDDNAIPLVAGAADALAQLRDLGLRLGIICDVGFTPSPILRRHLERHEVLDCFDHWSFSDEVGVYKPDPKIFEHALEGLGRPDPGACVHVGDRRRTDVAGAQAMGMRAVRFNGVYEDDPAEGPSGDKVVSSYDELLPALGLGEGAGT